MHDRHIGLNCLHVCVYAVRVLAYMVGWEVVQGVLMINAPERVGNCVKGGAAGGDNVHNKVESWVTGNCDEKLTKALKTLFYNSVIRSAP